MSNNETHSPQVFGPPYPSTSAAAGGVPTNRVDVPTSTVLLVVYLLIGVANMVVFARNKKAGIKFIPNIPLFAFCMVRIITFIMRMVWASYPHKVSIAIAAGIFVNAGTVILYIFNLLFSWQIVRATHPAIGFHKATGLVFKLLFALIPISLIMVIIVLVQSFYTLDANTRRIDHDIQLFALTYFLVTAALPLFIGPIAALTPPRREPVAPFGTGSWWAKVALIEAGAALGTLVAGYRAGVQWATPRPLSNPAWYHAVWAFYFFNFVPEIAAMVLYLVARLDRRFYIAPKGEEGVEERKVGSEETLQHSGVMTPARSQEFSSKEGSLNV